MKNILFNDYSSKNSGGIKEGTVKKNPSIGKPSIGSNPPPGGGQSGNSGGHGGKSIGGRGMKR